MKKVIITGASGQIGSYMVDFLLKKNRYEIICLHNTAENDAAIDLVKNISCSLLDHKTIESIISVEQPDYFLNFAGMSFVPNSWESPVEALEVNTLAVLNILECIKKYAPLCRFFNSCSAEIFGCSTPNFKQGEYTTPNPLSIYAVSKNAAKDLVKVYRNTQGVYAVSGILFNQESPRRSKNFVTRKITANVARIVKSIKKGEPFQPLELGNVDSRRDFSHVFDTCDGIWRIVNQEIYRQDLQPQFYLEGTMDGNLTRPLKDYVLASGESHSIREFVSLAFKKAGIRETTWTGYGEKEELILDNYLSDFAHLESHTLVKINPEFYRKADVYSLIGDSSSIRQDLHWFPKISFEEIIEDMIYQDLLDIYKKDDIIEECQQK
jgi:GDPmannose 4,6-dehydratase